ncbi:MAG: ubiE 3 [Firmicutes bacterium]|nr:ubiE 3 [Bacillota bacterium]
MVHKFNPESKHKLDNPERRKLLPPEETLCRLGLAENDIMADIGCGIGYFTLPAARIVGSQGKVYGLDILAEMLEIVEDKARDKQLTNVKIVQVKENDFILADQTIQYALACLVTHEVEDPFTFFREVHRMLQVEGKLAIIEWIKQDSKMGPPIEYRLNNEAVAEVLQQCGYINIEHIALNSEMYAVIAKRAK